MLHIWNWKWNEWCFRPQFCTARLYWVGDNLGEWDKFCYESCPWRRIDHSTCWPAVQRATIVPRMPPEVSMYMGCRSVAYGLLCMSLVLTSFVTAWTCAPLNLYDLITPHIPDPVTYDGTAAPEKNYHTLDPFTAFEVRALWHCTRGMFWTVPLVYHIKSLVQQNYKIRREGLCGPACYIFILSSLGYKSVYVVFII